MRVSMVEVMVDAKRTQLENALKESGLVEDYEIEDLDDKDIRKSVVVVFKELVDSRFLHNILKDLFPFDELKQNIEE